MNDLGHDGTDAARRVRRPAAGTSSDGGRVTIDPASFTGPEADKLLKEAGPTLVIDTSYGLTVAIVGHEPLHIADSRAHVEKLMPSVSQVLGQEGLTPSDIRTIVVASGPGPFTGLRAGIVAARALAFATGARLLGQDVLGVQSAWEARSPHVTGPRLVLAVNDARRKQLYWQLWRVTADGTMAALTPMDISYPQDIAEKIRETEKAVQAGTISATTSAALPIADAMPSATSIADADGGADADSDDSPVPLVIIGPGTEKYGQTWDDLEKSGIPVAVRVDDSALCADGEEGPRLFAGLALAAAEEGRDTSTEPLYLRRPDAKIPPVPKPVAEKAVRTGDQAHGDAGVPAALRAEAPQSAREATLEGRDLKWSSWSKDDLRRFATKTDPNVDDDDQPDELATFGSDNDRSGDGR